MEDRRLLASAALFRQLHDNKKDVYDVLAEFIRSSISWSSLWSFNVTECSGILEENFGFKIPDAVIRTCLKKRLKRAGEISLSQGIYTTTEQFVRADSLKDDYTGIQSEQRYIINTLTEYVEKVTSRKLSGSDREQLSADFHSYFLGGLKPCENSLLISEFIVKYSCDVEFTEKLNRVEEGLILYGGICHSSSLANHEPWRNNFTIYLDTEVLFFSQGFNGTLHKNIFDDFHALIREINARTSHGAKIELRYFDETKREVEDFFYAAEKIVEQHQEPDPSKPAMINITNGCSSSADVLLKKAKFYQDLRRLRIQEEISQNYYDPPTYVVDDMGTFKLLQAEHPDLDQDKIPSVLRLFTKINYLRRGVSHQGLEQSAAILVSGKYITRVLAFSKAILQEPKQIPFATDLDYLTERLWFKLNKGFGNGKLPSTFDVVARAQVILSTQAGSKVAEDYKSLLNQMESGLMSNDSAGYLLSELRSRTTKPEDFHSDNVEEVAAFLRSEFIEDALRQKAVLERKAEEGEVSQAKVRLLEDQLKLQADLSEQERVKRQQHIDNTLNQYQAQLRVRDITIHKERLKPLRNLARLEFVGVTALAYGIAILIGLAIIFVLRGENDTTLGMLSVALGMLPLIIMLINTEVISLYFATRVRARYRRRQRKKFTIRSLASYSNADIQPPLEPS
ncbi:hypothetical protein [Stutzerimonas stutzeri]|uniref:Uncharacterized protein n=1 Tax=Stutzerimonas stutzeri TaxID=316 RepID=A0A0D9AT88_STUST|nr:hypothetical protein [Stutzerimonas stutzeri]KJH84225.1 hypothetical protein UF78_02680 [Stutzerimonas stutzeri]